MLAEQLDRLTPPARVDVLGVLARRNAVGQTPTVLACLGDAEPTVRREALKALGGLGQVEHVPSLVTSLCRERDADAAKRAGDALVAVCQRAEEQRAACTPVLSAAGATADTTAKTRLFAVIGRLGPQDGESVLVQGMKDKDPEARKAAIRAFSAWPTDAAIAPLIEAATTAPDEAEKVLALRTAVAVCGLRAATRPTEETAEMLERAMRLATQDAVKKQILGLTGKVADAKALRMAVECLDKTALQAEAELAVVQLAEAPALRKSAAKLVVDAVQAVVSATGDADRKHKARKLLEGLR